MAGRRVAACRPTGWSCVWSALRRRMRRETFRRWRRKSSPSGSACCRRWLRGMRLRACCAAGLGGFSRPWWAWWRPTLLIPRRSSGTFSSRDWEHVFAHEIAHLRWRDHWTQLLLLAAGCVHWFNPVVWFGLRRLRADRELAADEWVLRHRLEDGRALAYGETLFKTLADRPVRSISFQPGMVGISEDGAQMKQRSAAHRGLSCRNAICLASLAGLADRAPACHRGAGARHAPARRPGSRRRNPDAAPTPTATPNPAPSWTEQSLRDDLLAAARAADAKRRGGAVQLQATREGPRALRPDRPRVARRPAPTRRRAGFRDAVRRVAAPAISARARLEAVGRACCSRSPKTAAPIHSTP